MSTRDEILQRIRVILSRPDLPFPPVDAPPLPAEERMEVTAAEGDERGLALRFGTELAQLYGTYEVLDSAVEARLALVNRLTEWDEEETAARKGPTLNTGQERLVLTWHPDRLPVPGLAEMMEDVGWKLITPRDLGAPDSRDAVRFIRFGLTGVDAAFAATGSMLLASAGGQSRAASHASTLG